MSTTRLDYPQTEDERVERWRLEQLVAAGYSHPAARVLAEHGDVDLHLAIDLARQGCPEPTALRILL